MSIDPTNVPIRVHLDKYMRPTKVTVDGMELPQVAAVTIEHRAGGVTKVGVEMLAFDYDVIREDDEPEAQS